MGNRCHIGRAKNTLCKLTKSTPKMKKKTFGELAMVLGDCQWLMYTGRNYKGRSQKVSVRETIKLGRVRSVKLLCPGTSSKFAWAGSTRPPTTRPTPTRGAPARVETDDKREAR